MWDSLWRSIPEGISEALASCVCLAHLAITKLSVMVAYNVTLNPKDNPKNLCGNGITFLSWLNKYSLSLIGLTTEYQILLFAFNFLETL
jgi:hypothetical protein